jgi:hypothetical protein
MHQAQAVAALSEHGQVARSFIADPYDQRQHRSRAMAQGSDRGGRLTRGGPSLNHALMKT